MPQANILQKKSFSVALKIIAFCQELNTKKEYVLSKQLLRSGTSIGANIEEAQQAESRKDFISKFSISLKEAYETRYWLRLISESIVETQGKSQVLLDEVEEVIRILVASIKTAKSQLKK